jgi:asparagine synthetase B (glutamine-hydrolysing)
MHWRRPFLIALASACSNKERHNMPGLFGILALDRSDRRQRADEYRAMLAALSHRSNYVVSEYSDELGSVFIGVIGHSYLIGPPKTSGANVVASYGLLAAQSEEDSSDYSSLRFQPSGNFSFARYTSSTGTLTLTVDRYASEPLFYLRTQGALYFAPEVKALLVLPGMGKEIDYSALASFLGSGHFLGDQTLVTAVRKLPGGQQLLVNSRGVQRTTYWSFKPGQKPEGTETTLSQTLAHLIEVSMQGRFRRNEDEVIFLSGGLDSRAILAGALKTRPTTKPIRTVSWGAESSIPGSDQQIAALLADHYELDHRFMRRDTDLYGRNVQETLHLIDGQCDVPCMHPGEYRILLALEQMGIRKVFRGDEAFGWRTKVFSHLGGLSHVGIRRFSSLPLLRGLLLPRVYETCRDAGDAAFDALLREYQAYEPNDAKDILYFSHRLQNYLGPASYYKRILFSQRDPLLSDDILDLMSAVPRTMRADKAILYSALRWMNPELARFPYAANSGLEHWLQQMATPGPVNAFFDMQVTDRESEIWSIFDRTAVSELWKKTTDSSRSPRAAPLLRRAKLSSTRLMTVALPKTAAELVARRAQAYLPADVVLMRFVVLKYWFDNLLNQPLTSPQIYQI